MAISMNNQYALIDAYPLVFQSAMEWTSVGSQAQTFVSQDHNRSWTFDCAKLTQRMLDMHKRSSHRPQRMRMHLLSMSSRSYSHAWQETISPPVSPWSVVRKPLLIQDIIPNKTGRVPRHCKQCEANKIRLGSLTSCGCQCAQRCPHHAAFINLGQSHWCSKWPPIGIHDQQQARDDDASWHKHM